MDELMKELYDKQIAYEEFVGLGLDQEAPETFEYLDVLERYFYTTFKDYEDEF